VGAALIISDMGYTIQQLCTLQINVLFLLCHFCLHKTTQYICTNVTVKFIHTTAQLSVANFTKNILTICSCCDLSTDV